MQKVQIFSKFLKEYNLVVALWEFPPPISTNLDFPLVCISWCEHMMDKEHFSDPGLCLYFYGSIKTFMRNVYDTSHVPRRKICLFSGYDWFFYVSVHCKSCLRTCLCTTSVWCTGFHQRHMRDVCLCCVMNTHDTKAIFNPQNWIQILSCLLNFSEDWAKENLISEYQIDKAAFSAGRNECAQTFQLHRMPNQTERKCKAQS